ncbi:MAG: DMT family transporter [Bacillota bacterium]|nr:DMT family transporter [Bacillota bacterium]
MSKKNFASSLILLLTAAIWGFAFVAQKTGMDHVGPFTFNAFRFSIGACCVLAFSIIMDKRKLLSGTPAEHPYFVNKKPDKQLFTAGILCGLCLFTGSSLQQVALQFTTVSKCSFITAMYMVMVPIISVLLRKKISANSWIGVILSATGFYFLCLLPGELSMNLGDLLTLLGSLFWAVQIMVIDHYVSKTDGVKMAALQFIITAILSIIFSLVLESFTLSDILSAAVPILYGGFLSVGVAFTLQIVGQKNTPPTLASLILSLESVFAVVGGAWILGESLTSRETLGCILIFAGVLAAQIPVQTFLRKRQK